MAGFGGQCYFIMQSSRRGRFLVTRCRSMATGDMRQSVGVRGSLCGLCTSHFASRVYASPVAIPTPMDRPWHGLCSRHNYLGV